MASRGGGHGWPGVAGWQDNFNALVSISEA
jgi:hypothetical protein